MPLFHREWHRTQHVGWLRAAVLGANDGIVSTASLVVGVAAADATHGAVLVAGVAGLVAGAMSMAAGEDVSGRSPSSFPRSFFCSPSLPDRRWYSGRCRPPWRPPPAAPPSCPARRASRSG